MILKNHEGQPLYVCMERNSNNQMQRGRALPPPSAPFGADVNEFHHSDHMCKNNQLPTPPLFFINYIIFACRMMHNVVY